MQPDEAKPNAPFETAMVLPEKTRAAGQPVLPETVRPEGELELDRLDEKIARLKRSRGEDEGLFDRSTPSL